MIDKDHLYFVKALQTIVGERKLYKHSRTPINGFIEPGF